MPVALAVVAQQMEDRIARGMALGEGQELILVEDAVMTVLDDRDGVPRTRLPSRIDRVGHEFTPNTSLRRRGERGVPVGAGERGRALER